jgi:menaquinone-specific isochorismate synthase
LAVESVSEVLARICSSVVVSARPELLKLANVQHLATSITGSLRQPWSALEVAGLLHPTAAVCGTPRNSALELIREVEGMDRGRYGGPVGWVDAGGNGEFGIALRCAEVHGARARLFAGNGIVSESLPEDELEETRLKLRAMQSALET